MNHFTIDLDEFAEDVCEHLEKSQDGGAGHYARFTANTKADAIVKVIACIAKLLDEKMYISDDYGYPLPIPSIEEQIK